MVEIKDTTETTFIYVSLDSPYFPQLIIHIIFMHFYVSILKMMTKEKKIAKY